MLRGLLVLLLLLLSLMGAVVALSSVQPKRLAEFSTVYKSIFEPEDEAKMEPWQVRAALIKLNSIRHELGPSSDIKRDRELEELLDLSEVTKSANRCTRSFIDLYNSALNREPARARRLLAVYLVEYLRKQLDRCAGVLMSQEQAVLDRQFERSQQKKLEQLSDLVGRAMGGVRVKRKSEPAALISGTSQFLRQQLKTWPNRNQFALFVDRAEEFVIQPCQKLHQSLGPLVELYRWMDRDSWRRLRQRSLDWLSLDTTCRDLVHLWTTRADDFREELFNYRTVVGIRVPFTWQRGPTTPVDSSKASAS